MVLLRAFVNGNLGDDLFIEVICRRYPDTKFAIFGLERYRHSFQSITNLRYIAVDSIPMLIMHKIFSVVNKEYDQVAREIPFLNLCSGFFETSVFITGSYFAEPIKWNKITDLRWYKHRPHIIGCNFGPWKTERYLNEYRKCFELASEVTFRDRFSFELFKNQKNVRYAPDIVFNIEKGDISDKGYYLISVVNPVKDEYLNRSDSVVDKYIKKMAEVCNEVSAIGKRAYLLPFCKEQGDNEIANRILELCEDREKISIIPYGDEFDLEYMMKLFRECHMVVAGRFHAMIMALRFQKRVIPVIYNNKMKTVLDDISFSGNAVTVENIEQLDTDSVVNYDHTCSNDIINKVVEAASDHFRELDKLLKK